MVSISEVANSGGTSAFIYSLIVARFGKILKKDSAPATVMGWKF